MMMNELYLKEESYKIIGICMEVHKILGKGHSEKVYGDALEYEFQRNEIPYNRELKYNIAYKDIILSSYYFADFVIFNEIILELKAIATLSSSEIKQTLNYLAASKNKLGLLVNFGEDSLKYKRIIL
jgi:GxxExxY protein